MFHVQQVVIKILGILGRCRLSSTHIVGDLVTGETVPRTNLLMKRPLELVSVLVVEAVKLLALFCAQFGDGRRAIVREGRLL